MMAILLQSASASSMEWVVRTAAVPRRRRLITSHSTRRDCGSSPVLGSSSRHTSGELIMEMPTLTLR